MPWILLHQTWQMNLLWPMTPQYQSRDDLHTTTQNLADDLLWLMDTPVPQQRWLAYHYTKLGRWTYFGQWTPQYHSRDDLHTTIQNLADEPTLANGPPQCQSRDDLHTTTQNLADEPTLAEHNGKGLKALAFTISQIPHSIFSKHIFA